MLYLSFAFLFVSSFSGQSLLRLNGGADIDVSCRRERVYRRKSPRGEEKKSTRKPENPRSEEIASLNFLPSFSLSTKQMAYIASAKRTAFGAFGGSLKNFTAAQVRPPLAPPLRSKTNLSSLSQLGGFAGKAALAELPQGVKVDSVHFG